MKVPKQGGDCGKVVLGEDYFGRSVWVATRAERKK